MLYSDRFKDAAWFLKVPKAISIVGAGGIGSNTAYCLAKTFSTYIGIADFDKVEEHNVGTQFFKKTDVGKYKVGVLKDVLNQYTNSSIVAYIQKFEPSIAIPFTISALDNMATRKEVFEAWRKREDRQILIDGRLRANYYEVYAVQKGQEEMYEKTLFSDSEVDEGPCTFKQTAYFGMLIGARITHILANFIANIGEEDPIYKVPFVVKEFGDPFYVEIQ